MLQRFQEHSCCRGFKTLNEWLQGSMHVSMLLPSHKRVLLVLSRHIGDSMKVGDLVRHSKIKNTRQVGIITELRNCLWESDVGGGSSYKVQWSDITVQEYWYLEEDLEAICK